MSALMLTFQTLWVMLYGRITRFSKINIRAGQKIACSLTIVTCRSEVTSEATARLQGQTAGEKRVACRRQHE